MASYIRRGIKRRASARRRPSARRTVKWKTPRRPTYRPRRRVMTKRRVLNWASKKKRDTMLSYSNTTVATPVGSTTYNAGPAYLVANTLYLIPWIATARDLTKGSGTQFGAPAEEATRTATTCYMVGLKEKINMVTYDGTPWRWRRVCFTLKGLTIPNLSVPGGLLYNELASGYVRVVNSVTGSTIDANICALIFRGAPSQDWLDVMNAPIDTRRVSIKYDKTINVCAGNGNGVSRSFPRWHKMGHNLVYDDDEAGAGESTGVVSAPGRQGMGDYYVVDFIRGEGPSTNVAQASWYTESTLYWHEK